MTNEEIDWETLLNFSDNDAKNFDFLAEFSDKEDPATVIESDSWLGDIEELLMKDDDDVIFTIDDVSGGEFLKEVIVEPTGSEPEVVNGENLSPVSENCVGFENDKSSEANDDDDDDDEDDPIAKKRKRQLRNRDAAMRSRERKKIRVKELEMKSRYFEEECRRLQRLLHCCYAENHWLRCSLQTYGAPLTKPESAVLLLESLLLGSLVWLMVNIFLLPLPKLPLLNQDAAAQASADRKVKLLETAAQRGKGTKTSELWITLSFTRSKRCRASRTKMKSRSAILCF